MGPQDKNGPLQICHEGKQYRAFSAIMDVTIQTETSKKVCHQALHIIPHGDSDHDTNTDA